MEDGTLMLHGGEVANATVLPLNLTGNMTVNERPQWAIVLDNVATVIMTLNTITLMLGMGSAIYWRELWGHMRRPIGAVVGMLGQFVVLPATGFALSLVFGLQPYEALGVLMISCSPGGSFSNFFTFWVDGDLALSIMMTTCSSLLAFGGMPFNLWLYSRHWMTDDESTLVIPFKSIITSLAFITVPVVIGMVIRHFHEKTASIITKIASALGWLGFFSVATIWMILYWEVFRRATPLIYAAAFLLPVTGFTLAYVLSKALCQNNKTCRTIGIETGSQNMPVALSIILLSFKEPLVKAQMIIFPTLYGITLLLEVFLGIGVFQLWKKKCSSEEDGDYPMTHTAKIVEGGTLAEKEALKA
ncbi:ileal sodium/bile acid cotransporter-like isoform X2 [Penaeus japonicus]|nr:ileal sodium/bile acid cotransporter-like isoform X2 [Penaeus japonicus]XP_042876819.1 ileal sodium/bile acid cotransporter-like isoform X2 [Penaeus japonicus]